MRCLLTTGICIALLVPTASFATDNNATNGAGARQAGSANAEIFGLSYPKMRAQGSSDWAKIVPGSNLSGYGFTYGGMWATSSSKHSKPQRKRLYLHH